MLENKKHYKKLSRSLRRLMHWYIIRMQLIRNSQLSEYQRRLAKGFDRKVDKLLDRYPNVDMLTAKYGSG